MPGVIIPKLVHEARSPQESGGEVSDLGLAGSEHCVDMFKGGTHLSGGHVSFLPPGFSWKYWSGISISSDFILWVFPVLIQMMELMVSIQWAILLAECPPGLCDFHKCKPWELFCSKRLPWPSVWGKPHSPFPSWEIRNGNRHITAMRVLRQRNPINWV